MGGASGLFFDLKYAYAIVRRDSSSGTESYGVLAKSYEFRLLDHDHRELVVYHWQPGPEFAGPDYPHIHVSAALTARTDAVTRRRLSLDKLHLATGLVSPPAVVHMLIEEFGVAARRDDWASTLARADSILTRVVTV